MPRAITVGGLHGSIEMIAEIHDEVLQEKITRFAAAAGKNVVEEGKHQIRLLYDAPNIGIFAIVPPASQINHGATAKKVGELAISRDLHGLFAPKQLKGFKIITQAFGRPITPVRVPTKEITKVLEPIHYEWWHIGGGHGRARLKKWVSGDKFKRLQGKLYKMVGWLAAGFWPGAQAVGASAPAYVARHAGSGPGTLNRADFDSNGIQFSATCHVPATGEKLASDMRRRVEYAKLYRINALARALNAKLSGLWGK